MRFRLISSSSSIKCCFSATIAFNNSSSAFSALITSFILSIVDSRPSSDADVDSEIEDAW